LDDPARDVRVHTVAKASLKRFLYAAIFAGMKRQNRGTPAGRKTGRQLAQ
jgi:hypothetical protein